MVVILKNQTQGAVCSILMAIDHMNLDEEVMILNYDQLLDFDFNVII